jgi:hypothetical protein
MLIHLLGWLSTSLILLGAVVNARGKSMMAMVIWIIGDIGWTIYDIFINNYSHLTLCIVIIIINLYGIYRVWKTKK